jgi:hypothetical protein
MLKRSSNLSPSIPQTCDRKVLPYIAGIRRAATLAAATLVLVGTAFTLEADANTYGQCAHSRNLEQKISVCVRASKSTSYSWILHWVNRELARSHRERGKIQKAIISYKRSLAAEEREEVRREMEKLILLALQEERIHIRAAAD